MSDRTAGLLFVLTTVAWFYWTTLSAVQPWPERLVAVEDSSIVHPAARMASLRSMSQGAADSLNDLLVETLLYEDKRVQAGNALHGPALVKWFND